VAIQKACAYFRVSRSRKHRADVSIHRQRAACDALARENGFHIIEEFIEIELNAGMETLNQRPVLAACMEYAKRAKCPVLASSIGRVARNVNLLTALLQEDVKFIVGDVYSGHNAMLLTPCPSVPKKKPSIIDGRISKSFRNRRIAGHSIGNSKNLSEAAAQGREVSRQRAKRFALNIYPVIKDIQAEGKSSLQAVADELNRRRFPTARGRSWTATAVRRVVQRVNSEKT